jgi:hypothetical protein
VPSYFFSFNNLHSARSGYTEKHLSGFLSHSRYIRNKLGNRSQVTGAEGSDRYAPFTFCSQANIFKEILEDTQRVMVLPPPSDALSRLLLSKTLIEGLGR